MFHNCSNHFLLLHTCTAAQHADNAPTHCLRHLQHCCKVMPTPITFETSVSSTIVGITLGILGCQTVLFFPKNWSRYASIGMFLQVLLCAGRALTLVIQSIAPEVDCKLLGMIGMSIYAFWITSLDATLLLRSITFLSSNFHQRLLAGVSIFQLSISLIIQMYVVAKVYTLPYAKPYCIVLSEFSVQDYTLLNRSILYILFLIPFLHRGYLAYQSKNPHEKRWLSMSFRNVFFSLLIIGTELIVARVSQIPTLIPWLQAFFASINFLECQCMLMIIDDTKRVLKRGTSTKMYPSRMMVKRTVMQAATQLVVD
jgi:hypothetical protein